MARTIREALSLCILLLGLAAFAPDAQAQEWDLTIAKNGSSQIAPGDTITYSIDLVNLGPDAATSVTLTDPLPSGTTLVSFSQGAGPAFSCSVPAMGSGGTITCTAALFIAGATASFTLVVDTDAVPNGTFVTNVVSVTSAADVNEENNSAAAATLVGSFADLSVAKTGPASVMTSGGDLTYGITIANNGPDAAQSVSLADAIPVGTTFVSFAQTSGPAFSCTTPAVGAGGTVTCTVATLSAGTGAAFTLVVNTGAGTAGDVITNTASASSVTVDPDAGNNSGSAFTAVVEPSADLAVTKTGPATVVAGATVSYTIGLLNGGPQSAQSASMNDTVPAGTTFVSFAAPGGWSCTTPAVGGTGAVTCSIASLASGASASFTLVVQSSPGAGGTTITNIASATATTTEPLPADNSASAMTSVVAPAADLAITKTGPATVVAGATVSYAIGLGNNGPQPAQSATLSDTLPAGMTFVSLTPAPGFTCTTPAVGAGGTVSCSIATLASGSTASFTLVAQAPAAVGTTLANTASASSTTADPNPGNNSAGAMTSVVAPVADLAVTKTAPATVSPGANVSYAIGLGNNGPQPAQSTTLSDTLPAGMTFVSLTPAPGFTCTTPAVGAGGTVSCSIATLASGSTASFTLVAQAPAAIGTTLTNTASASSTTADPNPGNNPASAMTTVAASADLAVAKTGPASVAPGSSITYTITLSNNGPDAAVTTTLTDTLPAGTTFVSIAQTSGPAFTCTTPAVGASGTVSCSIAALASATSAAFTLVANAGPGIAGTTIANTASGSSATPDSNPANNSATASTPGVASQSFSGPSATGSGTITASFTGGGPGCTYVTAEFIPLTGHPRSPPASSRPPGVTFPHGLFDFTISGCVPGSSLAFTIVYPATLPDATAYYKYGPRPGIPAQWYVLPAALTGNTVTFTITDGGVGDDDLAANGTIVDQGGPGVPGAGAELRQVPTLSDWMQLLLAMSIMGLGLVALRRRPAR